MMYLCPQIIKTKQDMEVIYKPVDVERILCIVADRDKNSKLYNLKMSRL